MHPQLFLCIEYEKNCIHSKRIDQAALIKYHKIVNRIIAQ